MNLQEGGKLRGALSSGRREESFKMAHSFSSTNRAS